MAFEIELCASESCEGITVVDKTGFFASDNPYGYNAPPTPNGEVPTLTTGGVFGYSEYTLNIFFAVAGGVDMDTDPPPTPSYTANLLTWPHTIDTDTGYVTWSFTKDQLGVEYIRSGWWVFRGEGVWINSDDEEYTYDINNTTGFIGYLQEQVDTMMKSANPKKCGGCKNGCKDPYELFLLFSPLTCWAAECQNYDAFTTHVDYLLNNVPPCGC
jgi:hypothetical protein